MSQLLLQDVRYGLRQLRRSPGFTLVAVLTLALGIGANTIIFGIVNGILLRPLPVPQPYRLVALFATNRRSGESRALSYPEYLDYRDRSGIFAGLAAQQGLPISVGTGERAEVVWGEIVSENYFSVLGLAPALGRTFQPQDASGMGSDPLVVLSHRFWLTRFGGDREVIGKKVSLNGQKFTVVGVAPRGFKGTRMFGFWPDVWVPMMMHAQVMPSSAGLLDDRKGTWLQLFGRLKPGITLSAASAAASTFAALLERDFPESSRDRGARLISARSGFDDPDAVPPQVIIMSATLAMGAVGLILLLACANIANLLLAQASTRSREIAVRRALGASRARLVRQFLTESFLLALAGGVAAIALATWNARITDLMVPRLQFKVGFDVSPDHRVLAFALGISLLTAVLFGLAPALHATRSDLVSMFKSDGSIRWGGRRLEARSLLVIGQVSLSLVLLVGSGLFLKSLLKARAIDPALVREHRLVLSVNPGLQGYDDDRGKEFYRRLIADVRQVAGVRSATLTFPLPLDTYGRSRTVFVEQPLDKLASEGVQIGLSAVGLDYFGTVGTPLIRGRDFGRQDSAGADPVAIVNQTMARRFWGDLEPIGRRFRVGSPEGQVVQVVGVAGDGKYGTVGERPRPYMYLPMEQDYNSGMTLVLQTAGDPSALIPSVRAVVNRLDPNLGTFGIMTMADHLDNALNLAYTSALLAGSFGVVALLLAVIGIYGVVAYSVARRTREVGIRMALGASPQDVLRLVLGNGLGLALAGMAIGLAVAIPAARLVAGMLYDVSPRDLSIFLSMPVLLVTVVLLATYLPARRAMRLDPVISLRSE
jgi:predicted permease